MNDAINAHALEIRDLEFEHRSRDGAPFVLRMPSLAISQGEQVLLTGDSGSGKSTLLQVIAGLLTPRQGEVRVDGRPLGTLNGADLDAFRGRKIGMIFQTFNLLEGFTARENVLMALMFGGEPASGHAQRSTELLAHLGIDRPDAMPDELSIGQQQRVAVARALATRPALVLADEPTASLDPRNARNAIQLIQDSCREQGAALLCTSHDEQLRSSFDRVEELRP
ncbi:MAG: ABC transporter ATP-binding protein [Planctomycetota bacterium]|nr:ABC transporter ATP-binding protein [Planctomycetota bacterium]